ncbi:YceI family protein [Nonomuraea sp. NPDC050643]|uniref:YceI family protein n=1 Tax=Nonomuraea sp. NPDC050643 TaxID=3155660 RepID=UPI0034044CEF
MAMTVGPEHGRLLLRTSRQGLAATVGHDLTLEVTRWSGEVDPGTGAVSVTADLGSLRVVEGTGGAMPLTERDKREIVQNARRLLDADRRPEARYTAAHDATESALIGDLTLLGRTRPLRLQVTRLDGERYRATGTVVQSAYGIKPYSAFFGALKVADPVEVEAVLDLSH